MSDGLGKLFKHNKQTTVVSKYLSQTSADQIGEGIESAGHLSESVKKRDAYLPAIDYSQPKNFVRFGSAEKYYEDAFSYIAGYYPYDGSGYEKTKFFNDLNPLETYLFQEEYPRSTGYVLFNPLWGTRTALTDGYGFASAAPSQYIQTKGGPHSGNVYSVPEYRTSNLEFGGPSGSTVEFFYNKTTGMPDSSTQGEKQVIFDLWNGVVSSSAAHGRLRIEVFSGSEDRFHVTLLSGTTGFFTQSVPTTGGLTDLCSGSWHHYSFALNTSRLADVTTYVPTIDFYVDGACVETNITASGRDPGGPQGHTDGGIGAVTGSLISNIGSLRAAPSGSLEGTAISELDLQGYGKLSASLDEFRFWKSYRNPEEVGRFWFTHVDGGSNKYSANKDLGVYFKFNEGITDTTTIDSVVLDYSGRISNGNFVEYNSTYSRNTGSAIDTMEIESVYETKDPIIRKTNFLYTSKLSGLQQLGSVYDTNNNGRLEDKIPDWITEQDTQLSGELKDVIQILSTYFDTLRLQISQVTQLKNLEYVSGSLTGSAKAFPHNDRLLDNFGLETPEIFENISAMAQFLQRDEQINFDQELINTKNLIYKNVYNNLISIYKQKGTPQSIRNFVRCLGVGEEIISLNTYANNSEYFLTSSYKGISSTKKYVDFSGLSSTTDNRAVVYQYYDSSNPNSYGLINGSGASTDLNEFAFTIEAEFIFPDRSNVGALPFVPYFPVTSSLYGFHTPSDTSPVSTDLTWASAVNDFGLRVVAIKTPGAYAKITSPLEKVNDVYFAVLDRAGTTLLTSDIFSQVYDNQKWNLALRLKPKKYPFAEQVRGTTFSGGSALEYDLELYGVNYENGSKKSSFLSTTDFTYTIGAGTLNSAKRIFVGSHRTNFNGSLLVFSDVRASSCRYWSTYLTDENIDLHAKESFSFGTIHPYRNTYSFQAEKPNVFIPQIQTLALNWDFANLTGSNASGQFIVSDFSSGSISGYPSSYQDNVDATFSDINLRQHTGRGDLFDANASVIKKEYIFTEKKQVPDYATSSEMIRVLASDDEYFHINYRPENLFFAVEKSMYKNISERMLQLFASIEEFNNLIGEPVNKYRAEYKNLEKMREIFFRNVQDTPDFDKYLRFYKWLDVSMGEMIQQLMPASVAKAENVRTIVESHMLERSKIKYSYPGAYKTRPPNIIGTVNNLGSICPDQPGWKYNHAPLNTDDSNPQQNVNCFWWKTKTARANGQFGPLAAGALATRESIFTQLKSNFSSSQLVCLTADLKPLIVGGINQPLNKRRRITDVTFSAFEEAEDCDDELVPNQKVRLTYKGVKDAVSYKGELVSPFTLLSSSADLNDHTVQLGPYGDGEIANIILTNLHEDSIHPFDHSIPMQGPFTRTHVGGIQSRHVNLFSVSGSKRREANRLTIGTAQIDLNSVTVALNQGAEVPKGQYLRGPGGKSIVNISNIRTLTGSFYSHGTAPASHGEEEGVVPIGNFKLNYQVLQSSDRNATNIDFIFNNADYYTGPIPTAFLSPPTMRSSSIPWDIPVNGFTIGRTGSVDYAAPRQRVSDNAKVVLIADSAPIHPADTGKTLIITNWDTTTYTITAANSGGVTATQIDISLIGDADAFASALKSAMDLGVAAGLLKATVSDVTAAASGLPRKITLTSEIKGPDGNKPVGGTFIAGGGAEILCNPAGDDPTSGNGALSFVGGDTAPRISKSIFANRFSSPGSTVDSRQQFRDIPSDQLSPNNALPFRNIPVRKIYNTEMKNYTGWGGFITSSGQNILDAEGGNILYKLNDGIPPYAGHAAKHKTQRNTVHRLAITSGEVGAGEGFTIGTGSLRNNDFYSSPIPAGDRTNWFMNLSGNNVPGQTMMDEFVMSSSHYPPNITITTSSFSFNELFLYGPPQAAAIIDPLGPWGGGTYIWNRGNSRPGFVPWTQTRQEYSQFGNYYVKNNLYDFYIESPNMSPQERVNYGNSDYGEAGTTLETFALRDRAENSISYFPIKRFKEPPVTSKYKPLYHNIKSYAGTAAKSAYELPQETNVKYSYGNYLMGFANRGINAELTQGGSTRWKTGKIRRPYEAFRDNYISRLPDTVDGVDIIRLTNYSETIYPREIYTYLSASRSRLSFKNNFWKDDKDVNTTTFSTNVTSVPAIGNDQNIHRYARNIERISTPFSTSQGYGLLRGEQVSYDTVAGGSEGVGPGSGSIWPMDSYIFSDLTASLDAVQDSAGFEVGLAAASTLPCGELMLTSHGEVKTVSSGPYSVYERGNVISAQYIYSAPAMAAVCAPTTAVAATATIDADLYPITAVKATATITANDYPRAAAAASATITVGAGFDLTRMDGKTITIEYAPGGLSCEIIFSNGTPAGSIGTTCPITLKTGTSATRTDVMNYIATAITNSISDQGFDLSVTTNGVTYEVTVTLGTAGTGGNDYAMAWTGDALDLTVPDIAGGVDSNLTEFTDKTLTIQYDDGSGTSGTQTMTFKTDGTPSSATMIAIPAASVTSTALVAAAIENTITTGGSPLVGIIDVVSVASNVVNLRATDAGTHMNGKLIAGTGEDASGAVFASTDFAGGVAGVSLHDHTIILTDKTVAPGGWTITFKEDGTATSNSVIDVSSATSVNNVATAIATTVAAAQSAAKTAISVAALGGNSVLLVSDVSGIAMNGQTIGGTAEGAGDVSTAAFSGGAAASTWCEYDVLPKSPGGISSRPSWIAHRERLALEGPNRGSFLDGRNPFYNSYEDYALDVRLKGQEYTIVPEYRMSENLIKYQENGTPFALVDETLEITGANATVFDSTAPDFFGRYINSDKLEYLDPFMETTTNDFKFNKFPKHLKLSSDAVVKLLPYDGFYPADRSLQIASLFSSSYSYTFTGASGSTIQAMRSLLRPFYAPGIFYNSIKSGIAVDYPIRRPGKNENQFMKKTAYDILAGPLSGSLTTPVAGQIPGNVNIPNPERRRFNGNNPLTVGQAPIDFDLPNTNEFYWADRLPFESIFRPEDYIYSRLTGKDTNQTVLADINEVLFNDVTGSIESIQNNFYKKAISNFIGVSPEFFLKKKTNLNGSDGHMTKFVGLLGSNNVPSNLELAGVAGPINGGSDRLGVSTIYAAADNVYIMEVGLTKTSQFNMYNNPYAFGLPTATGSGDWAAYDPDNTNGAERPSGSDWPKHRGEFAPFTPPYFYGTSVARITFTPPESREYSLDEIVGINASNTQIEFINESGSYYDFSLDTYMDLNLTERSTTGTPPYGWNRAWQNRMDIDASICLTNVFPLENGSILPAESGKWVIMPKWECPILDFPNYGTSRSDGDIYSFSSSVEPGEFDGEEGGAFGMWHQYGIMPKKGQGVFMYIKDVDLKEKEVRLVGDPTGGASAATGQQIQVYKVPKSIMDSGKTISSLADLTGFDPQEVMRGGFDVSKAKRLGELGEDGEKKVSEAILAMPYYMDKDNTPKFMTLQAPPDELGPKIKEFRRNFTKYSLPPVLASHLLALLPKTYPDIPNFINPFGVDELDRTLRGSTLAQTPVVYLLEHSVEFSRQDLADIWQGILPDIGTSLRMQLSAVDHYVQVPKSFRSGLFPDDIDYEPQFPEILKKQMELGVERTGIPRFDMLNISGEPDFSSDGLNVDIKWFVFKVKQRGTKSYGKMMMKEVNGPLYDPYTAGLDSNSPNFDRNQAGAAAMSYFDNNAVLSPTYNWPYDYMSLVEMDKITVGAGFRPDLDKEMEEVFPPPAQPVTPPGILPAGSPEFVDEIARTQGSLQDALGDADDSRRDETADPLYVGPSPSGYALANASSLRPLSGPGANGNNNDD